MIHNPLFIGVNGDAEALKRMSEDIKKTESEMEAMYSKATGLSKEILSGLMQVETHLTDEQAVKLNFASQIVPKQERQALAYFNNKNQNEMKKNFKERLTLAMAVLSGSDEPQRNAVAMDITTDKGILTNEYDDLVIGDPVTIDGAPANTDTYVAENGQVIVVVDGIVTDIQEATEEEVDDMATLKAENETLKAELTELKASAVQVEELEKEKAQLTEVAESALAKLEELAKKGSTFTPPASAQTFKPVEAPKKETLAERKAKLNQK